jgi:hypothetical protein
LELRLGWSSFIPKICGHHGNKNLVAAISLLDTIRNHKVCQMRLERWVGTTDMFPFAKNCCCFCLLVRSAAVCSDTPLNFTGMCHMRGVTCKQWKLYFFGFCSRFCQLFPPFHLCEMWRDNLDACNLQLQVSDV